MLQGFPPIASDHSHVLILGSMPSVASLQAQQYYAHPRNAFWPIQQALWGIADQASYEERVQILQAKGVAVWDVLASCKREGSLDSAIDADSVVVNDFESFFVEYQQIKAIFFNGATAENYFKKYVLLKPSLVFQRLPSTSPAHASLSFEQKLAKWQSIKDYV
jgi:hypoxanthine-DNA glycosylase